MDKLREQFETDILKKVQDTIKIFGLLSGQIQKFPNQMVGSCLSAKRNVLRNRLLSLIDEKNSNLIKKIERKLRKMQRENFQRNKILVQLNKITASYSQPEHTEREQVNDPSPKPIRRIKKAKKVLKLCLQPVEAPEMIQ